MSTLPDAAALHFFTEIFPLRVGGRLALWTDPGTDTELLEALERAAKHRGARVIRVCTASDRRPGQKDLSLLKSSGAILELHGAYPLHLHTRWWLLVLGGRVYSMPGVTAAGFVRFVDSRRDARTAEREARFFARVAAARRIEIRTGASTLTARFGGFKLTRFGTPFSRFGVSWVAGMNKAAPRPFSDTLMGGQISCMPCRTSIRGEFRADRLFAYDGTPPQNDVTWNFCNGSLTGATNARIEHFSFGMIDNMPGGSVAEAERNAGACVIGVGGGLSHVDGISGRATVLLDGKAIIADGEPTV